jgi:hypothetical protein
VHNIVQKYDLFAELSRSLSHDGYGAGEGSSATLP